MHSIILTSLSILGLAGALAGPALAEPKAPTEEESADASFVESLLGKSYEGELDIEDWTDFGGGLVSPPIYVRLYQREDGTSLVLTSRETPTGSFVVTDALVISKPWKGYAVSISCMQGDDFTLRFIGDARGPESKEWWTEVRRAWEIALKHETEPEPETETETGSTAEPGPEAEPKPEPGKITKADTKGVQCANPSW
ncbi:MAG: hypothetical protein ACRECX_03870 [Methyloceanibacter sp.]|uniref:hypothetical protein n=1 Tax=Methyloceanibacter sp. TaxID=1965321 RepID=UPI003D6CD0BA